MRIFRLLFFLLFLLNFVAPLAAQAPNWREIVPAGFSVLINEMNDSIAARRAESDALRAEMDKLLIELNFERAFIFGKDDEYFKEGMHKRFTREPGPLQTQVDRNPKVGLLENLHAALYFSDKALFRWIDMLENLRKSPDMARHGRWAEEYNLLPEKERPKEKNLKTWIADKLACDLATKLQNAGTAENPNGKVRAFEPKFEFDHKAETRSLGFEQFPLPSTGILASFPTDGQFAFQVSESIPGVGYVAFSDKANELIVQKVPYGTQYKARWTRAKGETVYTAAEYHSYKKTCLFNLPKQLAPEEIYRLEIVALPDGYDVTKAPPPNCWEVLRGKPAPAIVPGDASVHGEVKVVEIYFRAGKYDMRQKAQTMNGTIDWTQGAVIFETDEPLDKFELKGTLGYDPPVIFSWQTTDFYSLHAALNSKSVYYYLSVPAVEPLENLPLTTFAAAELDHTLDAPFVRKTSLGNPDSYPYVPENRTKDFPLPGNYAAPAYKQVGVRDSLVIDAYVPVITKTHFEKRSPFHFSTTRCTLYVGELQQLLSLATRQQEQIRRRVEERTQFFFALEKRRAARAGKPFALSIEEVRQQELENLPADVKTLLNLTFPDAFKQQPALHYARRFPGTKTHYTVSLDIKFDQKK